MIRRRTFLYETRVEEEDTYLRFKALSNCQVNFTGTTVNNVLNTLQYSTNYGRSWSVLSNSTSVSLNKGKSILFKGNCTPGNTSSNSGIGKFASTGGTFEVRGNVMSLLFGDNYENQTDLTGYDRAFYSLFYQCMGVANIDNLVMPATTLADHCYCQMFRGCSKLTTLPSGLLPATTLVNDCYSYMFYGCTSLTTTPELPATTLATYCYSYMFYDCTSLTTTPDLPATRLVASCYSSMFSHCTRLTVITELPARTLTDYCYQSMFSYCTRLTTVPSGLLPATTLVRGCYNSIFYGCTSLTAAPVLPARTLVSDCYLGMFGGCTSLTTAPDLPAKTLVSGCYKSMFKNCSKLNYIKAMFTTTPSTTYTDNWVNGVASSGTYVKNSSASYTTRGVSAIPSGWTVTTASS